MFLGDFAAVCRDIPRPARGADVVLDTVNATRRFVRRQESWFGRDPSIRWLPYDAPDLLDQALAHWADQALAHRVDQD